MRTSLWSIGWVVSSTVVALTFPRAAAAQSGPPGQCECAPVAIPVAAPAPAPWQAHTWGVGMRVGSAGVTNEDASKEEFATGGVFGRYRWSPRLELELAIDHGRQQLSDGVEGELEIGTATASLLVHLWPGSAWDGYVLGGLGVNDRRIHGAADDAADARGHLALGLGVERRFEHLVLGLDVRALAIGPADKNQPVVAARATQDPQRDGIGGGQVTLSAGWYF
jgi:Outer membrane protein beta-barrel domain